jgi:hypothetical protein
VQVEKNTVTVLLALVPSVGDGALLRHARRAKMAIIGDFPDDISTWTMLMAANA